MKIGGICHKCRKYYRGEFCSCTKVVDENKVYGGYVPFDSLHAEDRTENNLKQILEEHWQDKYVRDNELAQKSVDNYVKRLHQTGCHLIPDIKGA